MTGFAESDVEEAGFSYLRDLGYETRFGGEICPEGPKPERASYGDVVLFGRLRIALARLNPHLPADILEEVVKQVVQTVTPSLAEENRRLHRMMVEGAGVLVPREDGSLGGDTARLIDFEDPDNNDWLAVNQFTVIEHDHNRRPDLVVFVNGLPVGVIELKNPGDENATLQGAFNQLQTYKAEIPSLFRSNGVLVIADGVQARIGALTAERERFMPWRTTDGRTVAPKG